MISVPSLSPPSPFRMCNVARMDGGTAKVARGNRLSDSRRVEKRRFSPIHCPTYESMAGIKRVTAAGYALVCSTCVSRWGRELNDHSSSSVGHGFICGGSNDVGDG